MKTMNIQELDRKNQEKVKQIWDEKNHAAVARKRGKGWQIIEVDEGNDDISSYEGAKIVK